MIVLFAFVLAYSYFGFAEGTLVRKIANKFACSGLPLVPSWHERKVRAAQGAPLPKVEAIGDSRCRQKKITAPDSGVRVRRWCKRPPAVG